MILFKSKKPNNQIGISDNIINFILENYKNDSRIKTSLKIPEHANFNPNWKIINNKQITKNYFNYLLDINNIKYDLYCIDHKVYIESFLILDIEGNVYCREQYAVRLYPNDYKTIQDKINDLNTLTKPDEFLFRLPEGLAQYPTNNSLNISGQWDLISNVNQWKKEIKEMSSKW